MYLNAVSFKFFFAAREVIAKGALKPTLSMLRNDMKTFGAGRAKATGAKFTFVVSFMDLNLMLLK